MLYILMAVLFPALFGCAAAVFPPAPPAVDVTGEWSFQLGYGEQLLTLRLSQAGAQVMGQATWTSFGGRLLTRNTSVQGTVYGKTCEMTLTDFNGQVRKFALLLPEGRLLDLDQPLPALVTGVYDLRTGTYTVID